MSSDGLASLTVLAVAALVIARSPKLRSVLAARVRGISGAAIVANTCICLTVIDLHMASMSLDQTKCSEHKTLSSLTAALLNPILDDDTLFLLIPSLAVVIIAIFMFREYWLLMIIGTGLNVYFAWFTWTFFQHRADCFFDPHGYEAEGVDIGYILFGLASLLLTAVFGGFLLLDRGRRVKRAAKLAGGPHATLAP